MDNAFVLGDFHFYQFSYLVYLFTIPKCSGAKLMVHIRCMACVHKSKTCLII